MQPTSRASETGSPHRIALRIALVYAIFGLLWIILSDRVVSGFGTSPEDVTRLQTYKGWFYVLITGVLVYLLVRRYVAQVAASVREKLRSERQYRAIVETALEGIALTDAEGRLAFVNAHFAEMAGEPVERLLGRPLSDFWIDGPEIDRTDAEAHVHVRDVQFRRKDGATGWVIVSICRIDGASGMSGHLVMLTDVTDRKRLQDELHQAQKLEAVGQLAGGVAHDFNNLLMAIFGYADLARRTLTEGHAALKSLEGVFEAAEQAAGVSRSLLTFSSRTPTHKELVDLNDVVRRCVKLLRHLLPASIHVDVDLAPDEDVLVVADATQIQQIIINLAINARDAMPGGGELRIRTDVMGDGSGSPEARSAALIVSDTGAGMSSDVLEHIFEPFYTTKPKDIGTGLGLAITHSIVRDHDASIDVDSRPGEGTTFTVRFPPQRIARALEAAKPAAPPRGADELILLAEDNAHVGPILASVLKANGYCVLHVTDGLSLLKLFDEHADDVRLVVTDSVMPGRSGLDCIHDLRDRGVEVPIILTTASVDIDVESELDLQTTLLRKPYEMNVLLALVARRLGEPQR